MIVRSVDVSDLSKFDFFNDSHDTINWLIRVGRSQDAEALRVAFQDWVDTVWSKKGWIYPLDQITMTSSQMSVTHLSVVGA